MTRQIASASGFPPRRAAFPENIGGHSGANMNGMTANILYPHEVKLSLVVPVFNEAEAIDGFMAEIGRVFAKGAYSLEFVFINDGSTDATLEKLLSCQQENERVVILDLSRNFGKEAALTAGVLEATGDVIVPMDVDLQDPPETIPAMIEKWREGYEVVLGHRVNRSTDSWAKRNSANWFYRIHNKISSLKLPENVGDFRLMDRCVVEALRNLPESCRFMKGIFAWAGFRTTSISYERKERSVDKSRYNGWKLWNLALDGITSFSTVPLRVWSYIGFLISTLSFIYATTIILKTLVDGADVPGYASIMVTVTFLGGLQLIGIGVLGEYLGRTYLETKRRPIYVIRKKIKKQEIKNGKRETLSS
jgi:glycosyltransferase involved in cell wall biosynthesis